MPRAWRALVNKSTSPTVSIGMNAYNQCQHRACTLGSPTPTTTLGLSPLLPPLLQWPPRLLASARPPCSLRPASSPSSCGTFQIQPASEPTRSKCHGQQPCARRAGWPQQHPDKHHALRFRANSQQLPSPAQRLPRLRVPGPRSVPPPSSTPSASQTTRRSSGR